MEKKILFICALLLCFQLSWSQQRLSIDFQKLNHTHDILMSPWGPFSKKYAGISHVQDVKSGLRFDFSIMPGYYRNKVLIPNVLMESGYFPWEASSDQSRYTYRYELEWKDRVYVDATYFIVDSCTCLVKMDCVNATAVAQNVVLNLMTYIDFPENFPLYQIKRSSNVLWRNAVDYMSLDFAKPRPTDGLQDNGWLRGEVRTSTYLDGRAIARNFGRDKGDRVSYDLRLTENQLSGFVHIVYRMAKNASCKVQLTGLANGEVTLTGTGNLEQAVISYKVPHAGAESLTLVSEGGSEIELNGFMIVSDGENPRIVAQEKVFEPEKIENASAKNIILKYKDIPVHYGIGWENNLFQIREVKNDELDIFFRKLVHNHVSNSFVGNNNGYYSDIFIRPIELNPSETKTEWAIICTGSLDKVKSRLAQFNDIKQLYINNTSAQVTGVLPQGKKYEFAQKMLKATILSDIIYPIYTQGSLIRHFSPGKWWNFIYTWDLGFDAIGLNEINPDLAAECINAYTTPVGSQSAFVHHGSPLPTQMYAFYDLWNKTQSNEMLSYFYPRLKQYYEFLAGRTPGSTTRNLKSSLLKTWDYFYNSGGWDDYPAQVGVHAEKVEKTVTPVVITAHCIRVAKILRLAAQALKLEQDIKIYDQDIRDFSNDLLKYSWNDSIGYFSYVIHNQQGYPVGHYKHKASGQDYNMGLDGAYPLMSGICTPEQEQTLLDKIFSEKHMWTPSGICVVDQSAPYYRIDGYWNGAVWMPHQYLIWKTMLDLGQPELAYKIAEKALDVYSKETDESYYTFEHFFAKSGRGAGWHQFSGLSAPVLSWYSAYYKIGTATTGLEIWIKNQSFNADFSSYKADLTFDNATKAHPRSMILVMNPAFQYKVSLSKKDLEFKSPYAGMLEITLPASNNDVTLIVTALK